ncbi:MAG: ATP-binding protein [Elusimicrobiota bacterium]|jgi:signal transduction histidine kinase
MMKLLAHIFKDGTSWQKRQFHLSDQGTLVVLRWLVFLGLLLLSAYNCTEGKSLTYAWLPLSICLLYGTSNVALGFWKNSPLLSGRGPSVLFLMDVGLIGSALYSSAGLDADLYLICFLIVYLASLSRRIKDAIPLAVVAGMIYSALLIHQKPDIDLLDPHILLRFPFFFILAFFSTYLSEETEKSRRRIHELEKERDSVMRELDRKQAQLVQAEKLSAMGHMAGALAHEIRNPLCVIIGYVSELRTLLPEAEPAQKFLAIVERCANRCNELVENLLRFSRLPQGEERFQLNSVVTDALELVRIGKKALGVQILTEFQCDLWMVGRPGEIQQIVLNLCSNAMDALPAGGTVTVRTRRQLFGSQDWMVVEVRDTGIGIPEDLRKKIFDPFFTTKPSGKGTGLGLSIVRDIVRNYHGLIEVQSELNKGTTFVIRLPAARMTAEVPVSPAVDQLAA